MLVALVAAVEVSKVPLSEWAIHDNMVIKLDRHTIPEALTRVAIANDSAWYLSIVKNGYEKAPFSTAKQANWAFFPLHPLLWRLAGWASGEWLWSGLLLANLLAYAGFALLWHLARRLTDSDDIADDAVLYASFWPASYFMSLPQTEALFFVLTTLSFLAALDRRRWVVAVAGIAAGLTRLNGLFLLPSLLLQWSKEKNKWTGALALAAIPMGLAAFMIYLWNLTGNPFAFKDIQVTWGRHLTTPWSPLVMALGNVKRIAVPWNPILLHLITIGIALASIATCWRRRWLGLACFTALTLLAPLATGSLMSITRYLSVVPAIYIALALWGSKNRRLGQLWLALFAIAQGLLLTAFATGVNIGGA
jgi:Gpi18-like mannosyltransferase